MSKLKKSSLSTADSLFKESPSAKYIVFSQLQPDAAPKATEDISGEVGRGPVISSVMGNICNADFLATNEKNISSLAELPASSKPMIVLSNKPSSATSFPLQTVSRSQPPPLTMNKLNKTKLTEVTSKSKLGSVVFSQNQSVSLSPSKSVLMSHKHVAPGKTVILTPHNVSLSNTLAPTKYVLSSSSSSTKVVVSGVQTTPTIGLSAYQSPPRVLLSPTSDPSKVLLSSSQISSAVMSSNQAPSVGVYTQSKTPATLSSPKTVLLSHNAKFSPPKKVLLSAKQIARSSRFILPKGSIPSQHSVFPTLHHSFSNVQLQSGGSTSVMPVSISTKRSSGSTPETHIRIESTTSLAPEITSIEETQNTLSTKTKSSERISPPLVDISGSSLISSVNSIETSSYSPFKNSSPQEINYESSSSSSTETCSSQNGDNDPEKFASPCPKSVSSEKLDIGSEEHLSSSVKTFCSVKPVNNPNKLLSLSKKTYSPKINPRTSEKSSTSSTKAVTSQISCDTSEKRTSSLTQNDSPLKSDSSKSDFLRKSPEKKKPLFKINKSSKKSFAAAKSTLTSRKKMHQVAKVHQKRSQAGEGLVGNRIAKNQSRGMSDKQSGPVMSMNELLKTVRQPRVLLERIEISADGVVKIPQPQSLISKSIRTRKLNRSKMEDNSCKEPERVIKSAEKKQCDPKNVRGVKLGIEKKKLNQKNAQLSRADENKVTESKSLLDSEKAPTEGNLKMKGSDSVLNSTDDSAVKTSQEKENCSLSSKVHTKKKVNIYSKVSASEKKTTHHPKGQSPFQALKVKINQYIKNNVRTCYMCGFDDREGRFLEVQFHRIPSTPHVRSKWVEICSIPPNVNMNLLRICSRHFGPSDYSFINPSTGFPVLCATAVPNLDDHSQLPFEENEWRSDEHDYNQVTGEATGSLDQREEPLLLDQYHFLDSSQTSEENISSRQNGEHNMSSLTHKPVRSCFLCDCKDEGENNCSFLFKFPNNESICNLWKQACNVFEHDYMDISSLFVCVHHFSPGDIIRTSDYSCVLKPGTIPSVGVPNMVSSDDSQKNDISQSEAFHPADLMEVTFDESPATENNSNDMQEISTLPAITPEPLNSYPRNVQKTRVQSIPNSVSGNAVQEMLVPPINPVPTARLLQSYFISNIENTSTQNEPNNTDHDEIQELPVPSNNPVPALLPTGHKPKILLHATMHGKDVQGNPILPVNSVHKQRPLKSYTAKTPQNIQNTPSNSRPNTIRSSGVHDDELQVITELPMNSTDKSISYRSMKQHQQLLQNAPKQCKPKTIQSSPMNSSDVQEMHASLNNPVSGTNSKTTQKVYVKNFSCESSAKKKPRIGSTIKSPSEVEKRAVSVKQSAKMTVTAVPFEMCRTEQVVQSWRRSPPGLYVPTREISKYVFDSCTQTPIPPPTSEKACQTANGVVDSSKTGLCICNSKKRKIPGDEENNLSKRHKPCTEKNLKDAGDAEIMDIMEKVTSVEDLLAHLQEKNLLSQEAVDTILSTLSEEVQEVIAFKLKSGGRPVLSPQIRSFALTLHFFSSEGYSYASSIWSNLLPDVSIIRNWFSVKDGKPGFTQEVLNEIYLKSKKHGGTFPCCLFFTEMPLHRARFFDGNQFCGTVNFGTELDLSLDSMIQAQTVLMFFVSALHKSWCSPIAYFFINSLNSKVRANLVGECLGLLHKVNAKVFAITIDGTPASINTCKCLGANFVYGEDCKPWFLHPITKEKILVFWDVCKMMKLVRDTLGDVGCLMTSDESTVMWSYLKLFVKLQSEGYMGCYTELSKSHLEYQGNRTDVLLCRQTFSQNLCKAFRYAEDCGVPQLKNAQPTAKFFLVFCHVLNMLSTENTFSRTECGSPITELSRHFLLRSASNLVNYIANLKDKNDIPVLKSNRKTGFLGLVLDLKNIFELFDKMNKAGIKQLLTAKLSHQYVDCFFAAIRKEAKGSLPNTKQFEDAYKKLVLKRGLKNVLVMNSPCLVDGFEMLHLMASKKHYKYPARNFSDPIYFSRHDCSFINTLSVISSFLDVEKYVYGFIVRKILSRGICSVCATHLTEEKPVEQFMKNTKEKKFVTPTKDVYKICKVTEIVFRENQTLILKRKYTKKMFVNEVFKRVCWNVFASYDMQEHVFEHGYLDNHRTQICKIVIETLYDIKLICEKEKIKRQRSL